MKLIFNVLYIFMFAALIFVFPLTANAAEITTLITGGTQQLGAANTTTWYMLSGTQHFNGTLTINGTVNLVLEDNSDWTIRNGQICVNYGNNLIIHAQSTGGNMGKLTVTDTQFLHAGIGGSENDIGGNITINGGNISAAGGMLAAGIGGGYTDTITHSNYSTITINGGIVSATGEMGGAGIGSGANAGTDISAVHMININGGDVTAIGGGEKNVGSGGAGIGSGGYGSVEARASGNITISGGTITAIGGKGTANGAGIGGGGGSGGKGGTGGMVEINGGVVNAVSGGTDAEAIGHGGGTGSFSSGTLAMNGNGVVYALGGVGDTSAKTQGILFVENTGTMYGNVTLESDLKVPVSYVLSIGTRQTLTNNNTIENSGTIINNGTINCSTGNVLGNSPTPVKANYTGDVLFPTGLTAFAGEALADISLSGNGTSAAAGAFSWTAKDTILVGAGNQEHNITFTLANNNYNPIMQDVTVRVTALKHNAIVTPVTDTSAAGTLIPIELTVRNSDNETDTTFTGTHIVTVNGQSAASFGTFGIFNGTPLTANNTPVNVNFTNGTATANLILHSVELQNMKFRIEGVETPLAMGAVTVTPTYKPTEADAILTITQQPLAPNTNGGALEAQPILTVTDEFGNPFTAGTITATAENGWTLGGTETVNISTTGTAMFTDLTAGYLTAFNSATIQFRLNESTTTIDSENFNIPPPKTINDDDFGIIPPTGITNITAIFTAMLLFIVLSVGLWGYLLYKKIARL